MNMSQKENKIIFYKDEEGKLSVNTLFADEDSVVRIPNNHSTWCIGQQGR